MARYVFDIETDNLLDKMTTIHSLVIQDVDTGDMVSASSDTMDLKDTLAILMGADQVIGHNIIKFDIPAIQKVYPWFTIDEAKVLDTLVMSRLIWGDLMERDEKAVKQGILPPNKRGSHGLEAWGIRLGEWKGDYSKEMKAKGLDPWANWNEEMQRYCEQDVVVTRKFLEVIESKNTDPRAIELEHRVAHIVWKQEQKGFLFDQEACLSLYRKLQEERAELETSLQSLFDPWWGPVPNGLTTPKRTINYKTTDRPSTWEGASYGKVKLNIFNPGSRTHIADRLMKIRGWKPSEFTPDGRPKVDDEILQALPYPEAKKIAQFFVIQKRIGQIAEGNQAWLKKINEATGRIHGSVTTNGAVTGRMTHSNPNVAQTPSVGALYGAECRACWIVPKGKKLVGVDVSGLELRMLAHFMAVHDGGKYGDTVINGDIHTANQEAAGLPTRNMAKTFIYGFLYGAGNAKIGSIVGKGSKHGGMLKKRFLEQTPALAQLSKGVSEKAKTGALKGLDGRILPIRHQHAALNTLLQSAGALVCKRWAVECDDEIKRRGWEDRVEFVANIHDEIQFEVDGELAEEWAEIAVQCIVRAGEYFHIRIPLDGDANIGNNWKETH